jgi:antirestriction protein ArdC
MATTPQSDAAQDAQHRKRDFRQEVTDNIVKLLESNLAPWQKPWDRTAAPGSRCRSIRQRGKRIAGAMPST